jgi:hypothetical protein
VNSNRTVYVKLAAVFASANTNSMTEGAPCVRLGKVQKVEYKGKVVIDTANCAGVFVVGVEVVSQSSQESQDVDNLPEVRQYYLYEKMYTDFKEDRMVQRWLTHNKMVWITHQPILLANIEDSKNVKKNGKWFQKVFNTADDNGGNTTLQEEEEKDEVPESQATPAALQIGYQAPPDNAGVLPSPPPAAPALSPIRTPEQEQVEVDRQLAIRIAGEEKKKVDALVAQEVERRMAAAAAAGTHMTFEL